MTGGRPGEQKLTKLAQGPLPDGSGPFAAVVRTPLTSRRPQSSERYRVVHTPRAEDQWAVTPLE